jgi:hypothetical protein
MLYSGPLCATPRLMPGGMRAAFSGNFVFNRQRIAALPDLLMKYTTNPKASGGYHSFAVPVTRDMIAYSPVRNTHTCHHAALQCPVSPSAPPYSSPPLGIACRLSCALQCPVICRPGH